jgi:signal transduction histidine kinase
VDASPTRFAAYAAALAVLVAALGFGWEAVRFGLSDRAAAARVERDVRRRIADRTRQITTLAAGVARDPSPVVTAAASRDHLPALFTRLLEIARPSGASGPSATVYVTAGPAGAYRVLAWSDGPAEDLSDERLGGPRAVFLAPGTAGLRLIALEPIESAGRRIGVASAEVVLSPPAVDDAAAGGYTLETTLGPVEIVPQWAAGAEPADSPYRFTIAADAGDLLIDVRVSPDRLAGQRRTFRARLLAVAALPLCLLPVLAIPVLLDRRRRTTAFRQWLAWSAAALALLGASVVAIVMLARGVQAPSGLSAGIVALGAAAVAALLPVSAWWRRWARRSPAAAPWRFAIEHGLAGVVLAAALAAIAALLLQGLAPATLGQWQLPLMPMDAGALVNLGTLLVLEIAIGWSVAALMGTLVVRWHLHWRRGMALVALLLWLAPSLLLRVILSLSSLALPGTPGHALALAAVPAAAAAVAFALLGAPLRRYYRQTSQAMRLLLLFAALVLPPVAVYPMAAAAADQTSRTLIEAVYAPATANHPDRLIAEMAHVEREIDRIPDLDRLIAAGRQPDGGIPSQLAFQIWSRTSLAEQRLTSEIELYGPDRTIVSRFALNVPEFESFFEATTPAWLGTGCVWDDWSEVARFGAEERSMLHSERGVCDSQGRIVGAIVVHIVPDHRDLPFVTSGSPYYDVVGLRAEPQIPAARVPDLQVVVYGWSLGPTFTSGSVAWPIPDHLYARLYASRDPFWATLPADDREYHVYFMSNRAGIYALGYAPPAPFQHLTRLAELAVVTAVVFVLLLLVSTLAAPLMRRPDPPLRAVFFEIRASFFRKLFLFFVLAAVGPVLLFALAFGAYMTGKFDDDIQAEAVHIVTVARRVLEEIAAAEQHPDQRQPPPPDDVMVWIRQVVEQEVNFFDGPHLVATSQRDLFDSGLLPTRTPAAVYRAIALDRLPVFVDEDELGSFKYLVAAAPVSRFGRDAVLTVPLATRQREIDAQIDELNRGVLAGAVIVVLFAAGLGASVAGRVSDPVARLTRATRQIAAGRLDVRLVADTADELGRLVEDFNSMARTLVANRDELARSQQLKAWAEMARQVAHEIKNPLTPIQLAAEHLQRVHDDRGRPLGAVFDQCLGTVLGQVRLLRRIASEFSNFAGQPTPRPARTDVAELVAAVVDPYRLAAAERLEIDVDVPRDLPPVHVDRTLVSRAITNLVENAVQAMASGGALRLSARALDDAVELTVADTGVGMDAEDVRRAFEPYFSTKTAGSGLGLANARRNIELSGGTIAIASTPGAGTVVTVTLPRADRPGATGTS